MRVLEEENIDCSSKCSTYFSSVLVTIVWYIDNDNTNNTNNNDSNDDCAFALESRRRVQRSEQTFSRGA